MALILGVPTVELELQGTMQVPFRGKRGGELQPSLTDQRTDQATFFWPPVPCLLDDMQAGKHASKFDGKRWMRTPGGEEVDATEERGQVGDESIG